MLIWKYKFKDGIQLELIRPLTGIELVKMYEKHGDVMIDFEMIDQTGRASK